MYAKYGNVVDTDASRAKGSTKHLESCPEVKGITDRGHSMSRIFGSLKSRRGIAYFTVSQCLKCWLLESEISKSISLLENRTVIRRPLWREPLWIFAQTLYFLKLKSLSYILPLTVWVYLHSNFFGGLRNTIFFRKSAFRSFKVIQGHWSWYQSKARVRLPINPHSNFAPILHRFGDIAGFYAHDPTHSTLIFGVFQLHQIAHAVVCVSKYLRLFGHEIIFEVL